MTSDLIRANNQVTSYNWRDMNTVLLLRYLSWKRRCHSQVYNNHFLTSSVLGGGSGFKFSGRGALVPSPTCSQGESDSKLLVNISVGYALRRYNTAIPEGLSELQRFVDNPFALFVVTEFGVSLASVNQFISQYRDGKDHTVSGKSLRRG